MPTRACCIYLACGNIVETWQISKPCHGFDIQQIVRGQDPFLYWSLSASTLVCLFSNFRYGEKFWHISICWFSGFQYARSASTFQHINVWVFNLLESANTLKVSNFQVFDQIESPSTFQHVNFWVFDVRANLQ